MSEIKTCEQYVLVELEKCQWDIASLKTLNAELDNQIGELSRKVAYYESILDRVKLSLKYEICEYPMNVGNYICFDNIGESSKHYEFMKEFLGGNDDGITGD